MSDDAPQTEREELAKFVGQEVVLDCRGDIAYLGRLDRIGDWFLELSDADVHDMESSRTTKEIYVMEAAKHGIKKNRTAVHVRKTEVVSISLLKDVIVYY